MYYFTITLRLTQDGLDNLDKVLDAVFGYLKMLKEMLPSEGERIFKEIKSIEDTNFKFADETQPSDNVENLAENMHYFPPEHYLTGLDIYYNYNPEIINYVLESMAPEAVNIMVLSQNHKEPIQYDQVEEWFGTEYKKTEIPAESITRWKDIRPAPEFHLPEPNIFITDNFDLIPMPEEPTTTANGSETSQEVASGDHKPEESQPSKDFPKLLRNDGFVELWYKPDYKFRLQTTIINILFQTPMVRETAKGLCLLEIWCSVLRFILNEKLYAAEMAGLNQTIYRNEKGLHLKIIGFNQKLPILVDVVTKTMKNLKSFVTPVMFAAIKDVQLKQYHNSVIKISSLVKEVRFALTLKTHWISLQKMHTLQDITFEDFLKVGDSFLDRLNAQILIQGNLLKEDAIAIADSVRNNLNWKALSEEERPKMRVYQLSLGEKYCRVNSFNTQDYNSIVTNYYQCGMFTIKESCILDTVMLLMEEPLFDNLRTKEQLGYSVYCTSVYTYGVLGFIITVNTQADKYSTNHVDKRIENFLKGFRKEINALTAKTFEQTKNALIKSKRMMDVELRDEVARNWGEINNHEYFFDRIAEEIKTIKELTIEEIRTWLDDHTQAVSNKARKLSLQIIGKKKDAQAIANLHTDKKIKVDQPSDLPMLISEYVLKFVAKESDEKTPVDDVHNSKAFFDSVESFQRDLQLYPERRKETLPIEPSS